MSRVKTIIETAKLVAKPEAVAETVQSSTKLLEDAAITLRRGGHVEATTDGTSQVLKAHPDLPIAKGTPSEREVKWVSSLVNQPEFSEYTLIGKMERGMRGAWLMRSGDGQHHILKLLKREDTTDQIRQSAEISRMLNTQLVRTPRFQKVGYAPSHGSWYVQELLPGVPAPAPTGRLINGMLQFNDRQAGGALTGSHNWSDDVMNVLYHDSQGWQKHIAESGEEGKELIQRVQGLVDRNRSLTLKNDDIVHGDFQHYNALVNRNGKLSGYVDWEGAGRGDRGFDVSRLLFDAHLSEKGVGYKVNPETLEMLSNRVRNISGKQASENYAAYWALQLGDFGVRYATRDQNLLIGVGRRVLQDLSTTARI